MLNAFKRRLYHHFDYALALSALRNLLQHFQVYHTGTQNICAYMRMCTLEFIFPIVFGDRGSLVTFREGSQKKPLQGIYARVQMPCSGFCFEARFFSNITSLYYLPVGKITHMD